MDRPGFDEIFMSLASHLAKRSTCSRTQVGCVVVSSDNQRVLAIGYNGSWKGGPNECDSSEPGNCGCVHAEDNCLMKLNPFEPVDKTMYVTMQPCRTCAKRLLNAGIDSVVYRDKYRNEDGIKILKEAGVRVELYSGPLPVDQEW